MAENSRCKFEREKKEKKNRMPWGGGEGGMTILAFFIGSNLPCNNRYLSDV